MREKILGKLSYRATQLHNKLKPAESWNIDVHSLSLYPIGTLGHELHLFYQKNQFHPIAGMEYHDADHIILGLDTDVKSEVVLQFFLWGNGKKTLFCMLACLSSIIILPEMWFKCLLAYKKGKTFQPVWHVNLKNELKNSVELVRLKFLRHKYQMSIEQNIPAGTFYYKIF